MSAESGASVSSTVSEWGVGDPGTRMTGVHLRVLGGPSVWPLVFHELMAAEDRRQHVGQRLAEADFEPEPLKPRSAGAYFLNRVLRGEAVDWTSRDVPPGEVDRVLAALGLYHVRVRCVIPEELGGYYESVVSVCCYAEGGRYGANVAWRSCCRCGGGASTRRCRSCSHVIRRQLTSWGTPWVGSGVWSTGVRTARTRR
jgi:hypothetical protein